MIRAYQIFVLKKKHKIICSVFMIFCFTMKSHNETEIVTFVFIFLAQQLRSVNNSSFFHANKLIAFEIKIEIRTLKFLLITFYVFTTN